MNAPASPPQPDSPLSYTEASNRLATILDTFRTDTLTLEESLQLFEEGIHHLQTCQQTLRQSRGKVEELVQQLNEDGQFLTRPLEPEE